MLIQQAHGIHGRRKPLATGDDGVVAASAEEHDVAVSKVITVWTACKQIPWTNTIRSAVEV